MPSFATWGSCSTTIDNLRRLAPWLGWLVVVWVVLFWRLGYPSFWDPDEAHYAEATRAMLASGDWLVPLYNGQPFFDKPILFYAVQMLAFGLLGPTELAARLVPALSALGLFGCVWWLGAKFFDAVVAKLGVLILALLPATFALSRYAILDMTFTAFLFSGLAMIAVAALRDQQRLQYPGYLLVALAVLTKGLLAIVLAGLAFGLVLLIAPDARRPLLRLRWGVGLCAVVVLSAPWFLSMWWRFGGTFVEGYVLRENVWLYTRPLFGPAAQRMFYVRIIPIALVPWTPVLVGRLVDIARGDRCSTEERLLWAWAVAVTGFFTFSHFKLDHYVYPMAPALCLLAAHAWQRVCRAEFLRPHLGTAVGAGFAAGTLIAAGIALVPRIDQLPLEMSPWVKLAPAAFVVSGLLLLVRLVVGRLRPPAVPIGIAGGLLMTYAVVVLLVLPQFERAKPVKDLAQWVAASVPEPDSVGTYRMDRWNTSWRFYVGRQVERLDTPEQFGEFLQRPGHHFALMLRGDFEMLMAAGYRIRVVRERPGLFTTTGRAIGRDRQSNWRTFVIATDAPDRR